MRRRLDAAGYLEIKTPQLMDARQWEKSGHWGKYRENMFVVPDEIPSTEDDAPVLSGDGDLMALKPMNCPAHVLVFKQGITSYRDLPLRLAEFGCCHRNEPHGALHGILRVRQFTQDDAPHLLPRGPADRGGARRSATCSTASIATSASTATRSSSRCAPTSASARDEMWDWAEQSLRDAVRAAGRDTARIWLGGAARRRRLLRAQARMASDRRDRPHLAGRHDADRHRAARAARRDLHRRGRREAPPGDAPPRDPRHVRALHRHPDRASCRQVPAVAGAGAGGGRDDRLRRRRLCAARSLRSSPPAGIRVETDLRNEKINYKVREHSLAKVPLLLVVGKREAEEGTVALRRLGSEERQQMMSLDEAVAMIAAEAVPPDLR